LGHFALIGLCRVHTLLADYVSALRVLDPIDLANKRQPFGRVTSCHVSLCYHMGFSYMMLRRNMDAIKTFSYFLQHFSRSRHHSRGQQQSYQQEAIASKVHQMHGLLAIATTLCPYNLDDSLESNIREKFESAVEGMRKCDTKAFEEMFNECCPKFVNVVEPVYEGEPTNQDLFRLQRRIFINEIQQRAHIPNVSGYLKVCKTVTAAKMASFLKTDPDDLHTWLMALKHKTRSLRWKSGSPSSGQWLTSSEVDFFVRKAMVHIAEPTIPRRYGDFFIRNILKFEDLIADINQSAHSQQP
jgi:translation initiation factor 3 subunit L